MNMQEVENKMNELHNKAIETTKKAGWGNNRFHRFVKNAIQEEFLDSQKPFFYAVQAFPRFLCLLASKIEDSENRFSVVENIFEEHGNGDKKKYHVQSYKDYLNALGGDGSLSKNPWVEDWIHDIFISDMNGVELASYLAGIEYVYALVCEDVSKYIETLKLVAPQSHYAKHAVLDWEHGKELLEVAYSLAGDEDYQVEHMFEKGQKDFLKMYGQLFFPTFAEVVDLNKDPVSFYYSRESSTLEKKIAKAIPKKELNVLMIASGGEHLFEMMTIPKMIHYDMIDMNEHQINLAKKKFIALNVGNSDNPILKEQNVGKFEKMFAILRSYFEKDELNSISMRSEKDLDKLEFIVNILFSNKYLNAVFGDAATKYTVDSFAKHFTFVFMEKLSEKEENIKNIFYGKDIRNFKELSDKMKSNESIQSVRWIVDSPQFYKSDKTYDIVDISNIGDWMSQKDYAQVIENCKIMLNPNGKIIARKLLGDYSLKSVFNSHGFKVEESWDETCFYSEVVVATI